MSKLDEQLAKVYQRGRGAVSMPGQDGYQELESAIYGNLGVKKTPSPDESGTDRLEKSDPGAPQEPQKANSGAKAATTPKKAVKKPLRASTKKKPLTIGDPVVIGGESSFYKKSGMVTAIYQKLDMARVYILMDIVESGEHQSGQFKTIDVKLSSLCRPGEPLPKRKLAHVILAENL